MINHYAVLNVSSTASQDEITAAYRRKAQTHHPDRSTGDVRMFQMIQQAYSVIGDADKRAMYDDVGDVVCGEQDIGLLAELELKQAIDKVITTATSYDYVGFLDSEFRRTRKNIVDSIELHRAQILTYERFLHGRVRCMGETNLFVDVARTRIAERTRAIEDLTIGLKIIDEAITQLSRYSDTGSPA